MKGSNDGKTGKVSKGTPKDKTPKGARRLFLPKIQNKSVDVSLFCEHGHELAIAGIAVTLGNCLENLYSKEELKCHRCGFCERFVALHRQPESVGTKFALIYPQKKVAYASLQA